QVKGESRWPRRFRSVVVQDVSFAYSVFDPPVISHIDLEIRAGEKIAIVGPSGSGKSTLLKIITGLDQPTAGVVSVDGIDIKHLNRKSLTTAVSYGNQESAVFNATIRENILAGASTSEDLAELVTGVGLDSVVRSSPLGMETMISARGANLSGGQKQRLVLARALARDPQILILDEPTSALDNESEAQVMAFLQTRVETCVVVAHRLATIRDFDRIIVLNNGAVVETGTHDQLMSQKGIYYDLYSNNQGTNERLRC
ncbi:ATP-binding cassette domain-containing protein, partial [Rothia terrae]|uniref:ATP-binding cassette domain-containing protein n=1 Tax=Rothia terrae TaxID=396015 RepID=UPI0033C7A697